MKLANEKSLSELMIASQRGDGDSYEIFLSRATDLLIPFIRKKADREEFIDDILQDTLISIHRSRHTFLPDRPLEAWLYVICDHRITDFYRKFRRTEKAEVAMFEDVEIGELFQIETKNTVSNSLSNLLDNLPEKQSQIITLMKIEGFSIKEVSQKMNMSEASVKVTAFRGYQALKRLKGILEDE